MAAILTFLMGVLLHAIVLMVLISFASPGFLASSVGRLMAVAGILLYGLVSLLKRQLPADAVFRLAAVFLIWLAAQAAGQFLKLPSLGLAAPWDIRIDLFAMFLTGVGLYLVAGGALLDRRAVTLFGQFLVVVSTVVSFYCLYLFCQFPQVESIKAPFPYLDVLGPWAGMSIQPNNLINLFYPGFFFAGSFMLYAFVSNELRGDPPRRISLLFLNLVFFLIILAALLMTKSRGGIVAFLAGMAVYIVFYTMVHRRRAVALQRVGLVLALALFFLLIFGIKDVIREVMTLSATLTDEAQLKGSRSLTIGASIQLIQRHGLWGVGLGNFQFGWLLYHTAPFLEFPRFSYNDFLWMWAETGLPGFLSFAGIFAVFMIRCFRDLRRTRSYLVAYLMIASLASCVAWIVHSLMDHTFYVPAVLWLVMIVMGIGTAAGRMDVSAGPAHAAVRGTWLDWLLMIFVMAASVGIGSVYVGKLEAYRLLKGAKTEETLLKAAAKDPWNWLYRAQLAAFYDRVNKKKPSPETLDRSITAIDEAIERAPFELELYVRRAGIFFEAGKLDEARRTFEAMQSALPDFYLGELAASGFYITAAVESADRKQIQDLEYLSMKHFLRACELNPHLPKIFAIGPYTSAKGLERFRELLYQKKL